MSFTRGIANVSDSKNNLFKVGGHERAHGLNSAVMAFGSATGSNSLAQRKWWLRRFVSRCNCRAGELRHFTFRHRAMPSGIVRFSDAGLQGENDKLLKDTPLGRYCQ